MVWGEESLWVFLRDMFTEAGAQPSSLCSVLCTEEAPLKTGDCVRDNPRVTSATGSWKQQLHRLILSPSGFVLVHRSYSYCLDTAPLCPCETVYPQCCHHRVCCHLGHSRVSAVL